MNHIDTIIISDLAVQYHVGVTAEERAQLQRLLVSVEIDYDFSGAAAWDDLRRTIDYYAVAQRLLHLGDGREWKLIETVAVDVASAILSEFGPVGVRVEVKKFAIPEAAHTAVRVARRRA